MRYSEDPPAGSPFFIDQGGFDPYPNCAYERQLVQSGKRVLMAFPMPHNTSYGLAEGVSAPATLRKFVKTLWMEGEVGGRADDKAVLGRVALGGFSSGGNSALQAIKDFGNSIDELYLFDPGLFKGLRAAATVAWRKQRPQAMHDCRRLPADCHAITGPA